MAATPASWHPERGDPQVSFWYEATATATMRKDAVRRKDCSTRSCAAKSGAEWFGHFAEKALVPTAPSFGGAQPRLDHRDFRPG
mmetsp:Transcript_28841/g.79493  ORF Transcript_28841/g.79493 Transcript_28841/m.79493 type:complete len:84 (+) Transcript_28841:210-461(+)